MSQKPAAKIPKKDTRSPVTLSIQADAETIDFLKHLEKDTGHTESFLVNWIILHYRDGLLTPAQIAELRTDDKGPTTLRPVEIATDEARERATKKVG